MYFINDHLVVRGTTLESHFIMLVPTTESYSYIGSVFALQSYGFDMQNKTTYIATYIAR